MSKKAKGNTGHPAKAHQRRFPPNAVLLHAVTQEFEGEHFTVVFTGDDDFIYHGEELDAHLTLSAVNYGRKNDDRHFYDERVASALGAITSHMHALLDSAASIRAWAALSEERRFGIDIQVGIKFIQWRMSKADTDASAGDREFLEFGMHRSR